MDAGDRCPSVESVSASPETTPVAAKFDLTATIVDNGAAAAISFNWHLSGVSIGTLETDPATTDATFVCTALGTQTVELTITGGDPTAPCASSGRVTIDCTSLCGNGTLDPGEACDPPDGVACDSACSILNRCPVVSSVVPTKPVMDDFGDTVVTASASDPDPGDTLTYAWSATAGSFFAGQLGPSPSYECTSVGVQTVTVTVSDGKCSTAGSAQITCLASCGNNVVEPGEACDPPDDSTCDRSCQSIPIVCGNGIVQPGEDCEFTNGKLCSNCRLTNCGGCFVAVGGGAGICAGLSAEDSPACNSLVGCATTMMGACAFANGGLGCYCLNSNCSAGANGPCAAQFEALAHSHDVAVVRAEILDPSTPVGRVASGVARFATSSCGFSCR